MTRKPGAGTFAACFLLALLILAPSALVAGPSSPPPSAAPVPPALVGTWHTVSIDGDCLFLIIREVRLTLKADGSYVASVRFRDDSVKSMTGSFQVKHGHLLVFHNPATSQEGLLRYQVRDKDRKLRVHDEKFSVTVDLTRIDTPPDSK